LEPILALNKGGGISGARPLFLRSIGVLKNCENEKLKSALNKGGVFKRGRGGYLSDLYGVLTYLKNSE